MIFLTSSHTYIPTNDNNNGFSKDVKRFIQ